MASRIPHFHYGGTQAPLRQVKLLAHTLPHLPQLLRSNAVLTQVPLHDVRPVWHTHWPPTQPVVSGVPPHEKPHMPQLFRLVWRSTQVPLQLVWPTGHWHWPATQPWLKAHWVPHLPQLFRSDWRSRHTPLHTPKPPEQ